MTPATTPKGCPHCASRLELQERPYSLYGMYLGRFPFYVCSVCRRVYHSREASLGIEAAAKARGLWGREAALELGSAANVQPAIVLVKNLVMVSGRPHLSRPMKTPKKYGVSTQADVSKEPPKIIVEPAANT